MLVHGRLLHGFKESLPKHGQIWLLYMLRRQDTEFDALGLIEFLGLKCQGYQFCVVLYESDAKRQKVVRLGARDEQTPSNPAFKYNGTSYCTLFIFSAIARKSTLILSEILVHNEVKGAGSISSQRFGPQ